MSSSRIPVAEIFGPTIQGEGPLAGTPCSFLRLGGCDYSCVWCDTPHAVLAENVRQLPKLTLEEIHQGVCMLNASSRWLIITGGNPALHDLTDLVIPLQREGWRTQVETQGSRWATWFNWADMLVVSPKPPSAKQGDTLPALDMFVRKVPVHQMKNLNLKVVLFAEEDLIYAKAVHAKYPAIPFFLSIGHIPTATNCVNPEETKRTLGLPDTRATLAGRFRRFAEKVAGDSELRDARIYPQLHVWAWGEERGR